MFECPRNAAHTPVAMRRPIQGSRRGRRSEVPLDDHRTCCCLCAHNRNIHSNTMIRTGIATLSVAPGASISSRNSGRSLSHSFLLSAVFIALVFFESPSCRDLSGSGFLHELFQLMGLPLNPRVLPSEMIERSFRRFTHPLLLPFEGFGANFSRGTDPTLGSVPSTPSGHAALWSTDCQSCAPGHMGDPAKTCLACPSPAVRGRCRSSTVTASGRCDCEVCEPPFSGPLCDVCDYARYQQCTAPVTCQPGYGTPPLCEPAPPGFIALPDGRMKRACPVKDPLSFSLWGKTSSSPSRIHCENLYHSAALSSHCTRWTARPRLNAG